MCGTWRVGETSLLSTHQREPTVSLREGEGMEGYLCMHVFLLLLLVEIKVIEGVHVTSPVGNFCIFPHASVYAPPF